MSTVKFEDQNYSVLRRSLLRERKKFVDPIFPPEPSSIDGDGGGGGANDIEWRRPTELVSNPHLVVDGISGSDVMQGERGNAWFVTASAALTTHADLLGCVLPSRSEQDYNQDEFHPGIFRFVFCRHGDLYEVVIDDLLPTRKGRLVYAQSCEQNEFWSALLEKAYAKLHGNYRSMAQSRIVDAVASFVRGIPEHWEVEELRQEVDINSPETQARLAKEFQTYLTKRALLLFSLKPNNTSTRMGDWTKESLVYGRGYILTQVYQAKLKDDKTTVTLLKFQNAWFDLEWSGAWSDNSPEWNTVSLEFKDRINFQAKKDGIFWMSIGDALKHFTDIDICIVTGATGSRPWLTYTFHDEWFLKEGVAATDSWQHREEQASNAGGSFEFTASYVTNPQYLLKILGESPITVSFCLEQGDPSTACAMEDQLEIGMDVFNVELNRKSRLKEAPKADWLFARAKHSKAPSVLLRATFPPGLYVLVPCTKEPGQVQRYTLRSFSRMDFGIRLLPDSVPRRTGCCSCCFWKQKAVTRLVITKFTGVKAYLKERGIKLRVRIDCEASDVVNYDSKYYAEDKGDQDTFTVDLKVLLYRHQLTDPIDVELYYESATSLAPQFVGIAGILDKACDTETSKEAQLYRNGKTIPVKMQCTVQSAHDLDYF